MIIVPSTPSLSEGQAAKLNAWIKKGGKLIVFGEGALNKERTQFLLDVGAEYLKPSDFQFDYTVVKKDITDDIVSSPFLNYDAGLLTKPTTGEILAVIREPYFNRTYAQFSGHRETPYKLEDSEYPAVIKNGNVIFFAHHLDQIYYKDGVRLHRDLVENAIDLLYDAPNLKVSNLPSAGRVSLLKQQKNRNVTWPIFCILRHCLEGTGQCYRRFFSDAQMSN